MSFFAAENREKTMRGRIFEILHVVEAECGVRMRYACEGGSRAWNLSVA